MTALAARARTAAVAVALLGLGSACGDAKPATTTPSAACERFGRTSPSSGDADVSRTPAAALLLNVQVQASRCVDEVSFLFAGGTPGWSAGYADAGATLVVRMEPANGADVYDGPTAMTPGPPSAVAEVRRSDGGDTDAAMTWAVRLPDRPPFEVVARGEALVVRLPAEQPREVRCELPSSGVTVGAPEGWYVELSDRWACRYFGPTPFPVHPGTDASDWAVTVSTADVGADEVVERMRSGGDADVTVTRPTVGSIPVARLDVVSRGGGLLPAGFHSRMYVLDVGPRAVTVSSSPSPPGTPVGEAEAAADTFVRLIRRASP